MTPSEMARQGDVDAILNEVMLVVERESGLIDSMGWNLPLSRNVVSLRGQRDIREAIERVVARAERRGEERVLRPSWRP